MQFLLKPLQSLPKGWRSVLVLVGFVLVISLVAYQIELALPGTPKRTKTFTPITQPTPQEIGSYDILGRVVSKAEAEQLLQTEAGQQQLSPEQGAIEITEDLITLGREAFYSETFKNEIFATDVVGAINGPINLVSLSKALLALRGQPTTNLQVPIDREVTLGGRTFTAGSVLNTGLDVPAGSLIPLGMRTFVEKGKVRIGLTCAACHATVDRNTGRILEGAPNNDLNMGLILATASNTAAMFRQTGVNPMQLPPGSRSYINSDGQTALLPDPEALESAVDAEFLSWPPGNFDSTGTLVNNPSQIPSSYTFAGWPYGWSGHAAIGWFHGLTTLNSNVHATNSDATTGAEGSPLQLGIDKDTYLGVLLQNAANPAFQLPDGVQPSVFFQQIDPTPGEPAINEVVRMPGYPKGSPFMLDGLMASSPGLPVGQQLNGMSAFQNTLAPPRNATEVDSDTLRQGAAVFTQANCVSCHSGRYFTNNRVMAQTEVGTQPSRAPAEGPMARSFVRPRAYPSHLPVPLPSDPAIVDVPADITPLEDQQLAFGINDPKAGYKVPSLIGLYLTAPYLHDGGVAATANALQPDANGQFTVAQAAQMGMAGTLMQGVLPDPEASLRVLVDRTLRQAAIVANQANPDLPISHVDGSGHEYWVDTAAGFTPDEQTALIQFLLSLDDDPAVLP